MSRVAEVRRSSPVRVVVQAVVRCVPIVLVSFTAERFVTVLRSAGFPLWERTVLVVIAVIAVIVAFVWLSGILADLAERVAVRRATDRTGTV
jgi:hypothetical protein